MYVPSTVGKYLWPTALKGLTLPSILANLLKNQAKACLLSIVTLDFGGRLQTPRLLKAEQRARKLLQSKREKKPSEGHAALINAPPFA
jgi:hypothetical protein